MANSSEKNQNSAADNPQPAKKKVARKSAAKKAAPSVKSSPAKEPVVKDELATKKKASRKRVEKSPEPVVEKSTEATSSNAPSMPSNEQPRLEAPASRPENGEVRRESVTKSVEQQEDREKKRRRRRRRRGGDSREDENRGEQGRETRLKEEQPEVLEDVKDNRPTSHRVSVRQPEIQRQHDQRPSRYTQNPELIAKYAWQLFKGEIREEGGTLIDDRDAKKIAERAFRLAEIFLMEQARMG